MFRRVTGDLTNSRPKKCNSSWAESERKSREVDKSMGPGLRESVSKMSLSLYFPICNWRIIIVSIYFRGCWEIK